MSEMVERLAKVLAETAPWADGQLLPIDTEQFVPAARAALQAMREPTILMGRAFDTEYDRSASVLKSYRAMIDAALKD